MKRSQMLKQRAAMKTRKYQSILDKAKAEKRELTSEEEQELDALEQELELIEQKIEDLEEKERESASEEEEDPSEEEEEEERKPKRKPGRRTPGGEDAEVGKMMKRFSPIRAIRAASEGKNLEGVEKEMNEEAIREAKALGFKFEASRGFSIPARMMRATAQTVTEDSGEYGGKLVTSDVHLVDGFFPKLQVEELGATVMTGLTGNRELPVMPNFDFSWYSETGAVTLQKNKIDGPTLSPKRAAAGVAISHQLLIQSSVDFESKVWEKLQQGAARCLTSAAINGSGASNQPTGILNTTGIQVSALLTAAGAPTWAHIVELQALIEQADSTEDAVAYLCSPRLAAKLKTVAKDAGSGRFLMENREIDGFKTLVSSLVPRLGTSPNFTEVLLYGDFSQLFVAQWGGVNFVVDPYTGAGSGETNIYVNMYADCAIANPKGFAVNKFMTT